MNVLDLFSGIGGFSLGLERAGMQTVAFCEINPFCRAVLAKHWPDVPVFGDVRELAVDKGWLVSNADKRHEPAEEQLRAGRQGIRADSIDVICGGFPCTDISVAGKGLGITGPQSGLWSEYARIIGELRPRYVIVENVSALLGRGLSTVLGDLAALRYDAEWHCIPASAVGAPHRRDRLWLVAYPTSEGANGYSWGAEAQHAMLGIGSQDVADASTPRPSLSECETIFGTRWWEERRAIAKRGWWSVEPNVGRVAHGVPSRVDRLRSLGNAVVPQIPEIIGRAIMQNGGA